MQTPPAPGKDGQRGLAARPRDGRPGEGKRLRPDAPHSSERSTPPGRPPTTPAARSPPQGMHAKETVPGPHPPTPARTSTWAADPNCPPCWRAAGGGQPPDLRRSSQRPEARDDTLPPPQRATPARRSAHCGAGAGSSCPHDPRPGKHGQRGLAARPKDGRPGEGKRLTPDASHNGERSDALDEPSQRRAAQRRARTPKGQCRTPTPAHPCPQHRGSGPRLPAPGADSRGRMSA